MFQEGGKGRAVRCLLCRGRARRDLTGVEKGPSVALEADASVGDGAGGRQVSRRWWTQVGT